MTKSKFYFKSIPDTFNIGLAGLIKYEYVNGCIRFREDFTIAEILDCFTKDELINLKKRIEYTIEMMK